MNAAAPVRPLKIAVLVNEFPCISETFILDQITGLLELGHDVRIFAYQQGERSRTHADVAKFGLMDRVKYFPSVPEGRGPRSARLLRMVWRYFPRRPRRIWKCLNFRKYGVYESLNRLYRLEPLIDVDYDIVHCQFGILGRDWVHLKDIMDIKLVTSFRGYDLEKFVKVTHPGVYAELFEKGDLFLPVCGYFVKRLQELGCPKDRIRVHCSCVNVKKFPFQERSPDPKEIRFFTVARLVEKKGLEYSIRAVAKLVVRYPAIQYVIAGDGPLRPPLERLIHELGMESHIRLIGALPSEEVRKWMDRAHIFVLASVTATDGDQEGIPVSIYEALAVGLPVISTRHSGIPEVIEDGKSGFLVPERDVDALADKCEYLLSHPAVGQEFSRAGRRAVEQKCEEPKSNQRLADLYAASLNGSLNKGS